MKQIRVNFFFIYLSVIVIDFRTDTLMSFLNWNYILSWAMKLHILFLENNLRDFRVQKRTKHDTYLPFYNRNCHDSPCSYLKNYVCITEDAKYGRHMYTLDSVYRAEKCNVY